MLGCALEVITDSVADLRAVEATREGRAGMTKAGTDNAAPRAGTRK